MKTCSFVGHSDLRSENNILRNNLRARLREEIQKMIEEREVTIFLNGGMDDFDDLCAKTVHEIICQKPYIKSYLLNPYQTKNFYMNKDHFDHLFTKCFVPMELKSYDYVSAIPKRNRIMIHKSNFVIAYVNKESSWHINHLNTLRAVMFQ